MTLVVIFKPCDVDFYFLLRVELIHAVLFYFADLLS